MLMQGRKREDGKGKEAMCYLTLQKNVSMKAAAPTHCYLAVIDAIALCSKPLRQGGEVRNVGLCASNLFHLLVVP